MMNLKVLKFGGSSLADAAQFRKVAAIVQAEPQRRYVVASAPGKRFPEDTKITDRLYRCFALAMEGTAIDEVFAEIKAVYNQIIRDLDLDLSLDEEFQTIKTAIEHHAGKDYVASRGEYLNAKILANYLGYTFLDAADSIFFQENGALDEQKTNAVLAEQLSRVERAVMPGFYGSMPDGTIKTFSRGGSDITGAIVARAAGADLYENWTDVSGMLMADPRIVDHPNVIPEITYRELRELSYMGATVLHDEAVFPVKKAMIPLNIRNTNAPQEPGTMIVPESDRKSQDTVITGIAGKTGFSTIFIEKDRMNGEVGFGRKVLMVLESLEIPFEHIPTGIDTMSVIAYTDALAEKKELVIQRIQEAVNATSVTIEDGFALLAVVGRGMVQTKGTAGRVLTAIAEQGINIRMIDQGSCESNIIVAVGEADYPAALRAIYSEFVKE